MLLLKRYKIRTYEMGLLFREGEFRGLLTAGTHWYFDPLNKVRVDVVSQRDPWLVHEKLDMIIRESVKPMERIESTKILQVDGLGGGGGGHADTTGGGGFADNVVNSALRFRAQAPLVDQLLREIGVDSGDVGKAARGLLDRGTSAVLPAAGVGDVTPE